MFPAPGHALTPRLRSADPDRCVYDFGYRFAQVGLVQVAGGHVTRVAFTIRGTGCHAFEAAVRAQRENAQQQAPLQHLRRWCLSCCYRFQWIGEPDLQIGFLADIKQRGHPDHDLPADLEENRNVYYSELDATLDAADFVERSKVRIGAGLTKFNESLASPEANRQVQVLARKDGWIRLSPLVALDEPPNLNHHPDSQNPASSMATESDADIVKRCDRQHL